MKRTIAKQPNRVWLVVRPSGTTCSVHSRKSEAVHFSDELSGYRVVGPYVLAVQP